LILVFGEHDQGYGWTRPSPILSRASFVACTSRSWPTFPASRDRVKPGITGLWQVSGRSDLAWEEAVRLDLRYVENWSLALDLQILWKTGSAVFGGSGAY